MTPRKWSALMDKHIEMLKASNSKGAGKSRGQSNVTNGFIDQIGF